MNIYNTMSPKDGNKVYNFNILPYLSYFNDRNTGRCYINFGWLHICLQVEV